MRKHFFYQLRRWRHQRKTLLEKQNTKSPREALRMDIEHLLDTLREEAAHAPTLAHDRLALLTWDDPNKTLPMITPGRLVRDPWDGSIESEQMI